MLAIDKGTLQREIHKAGDDAALGNGNLAHEQGFVARLLQQREQIAHIARRLFDLVHEQEVRNALIAEAFQEWLEHLNLVGIRLADNHRRVHAGQHVQGVLQEFDRTGAVKESEAFVEVFRRGAIDLDAHLAGTGLRRGVPNCIALRHRAFALHCAGGGENGF